MNSIHLPGKPNQSQRELVHWIYLFFWGGEGNPLDNEAAPPFFSTCPISVASGHRFQDYKVAFPLGGKPQAAPGQAPRKALL